MGLEKGILRGLRTSGWQDAQLPHLFSGVGSTTATGPQPAQVTELQAASLESSVQLSWKDGGQGRYRIYQGVAPDKLVPVAITQDKQFCVTGLRIGQPLYFSVSAIDAEQREGALCKAVLSRAEDCTPPSSPTNLQFEAKGSQISLTWTASPEAKSYKVYCLAKGEKYRIPACGSASSAVRFGPVGQGEISSLGWGRGRFRQ